MLFRKSQNPANIASAEPTFAGDAGMPSEWETAVDAMLAGAYGKVPAGSDSLGKKLRQLADQMAEQGLLEAKHIVDLSIVCAESVTGAAEMMRDINAVEANTHTIAAASEELVASVRDIAQTSESASADATNAQAVAARSLSDSARAVESMQHIANAVEAAAGKVSALAEASAQIGEIVNQIEAIAKQTNLLALNATIEAARAGEMGKGFAVVASEVKNLANQTAKATDDIRTRISGLRAEMAEIVTSMNSGAEAVQKGREVIDATGEGMREVSAQVESVTSKIHDIATILQQQSEASTEVAKGIEDILRLAKLNSVAVDKVVGTMERSDPVITSAVAELVKRDIPDLTVHLAKSDHMIWRRKLAQMVVGRIALKAGELADHHKCRLGKWCDAISDSGLKGHPAFKALEEPHKLVHAHGIEAARRFELGDIDGAIREIDLTAEASVDVMRLLDELGNRKA